MDDRGGLAERGIRVVTHGLPCNEQSQHCSFSIMITEQRVSMMAREATQNMGIGPLSVSEVVPARVTWSSMNLGCQQRVWHVPRTIYGTKENTTKLTTAMPMGSRYTINDTHLACASSKLWSVMVMICCRISPISCFLASCECVCSGCCPCCWSTVPWLVTGGGCMPWWRFARLAIDCWWWGECTTWPADTECMLGTRAPWCCIRDLCWSSMS